MSSTKLVGNLCFFFFSFASLFGLILKLVFAPSTADASSTWARWWWSPKSSPPSLRCPSSPRGWEWSAVTAATPSWYVTHPLKIKFTTFFSVLLKAFIYVKDNLLIFGLLRSSIERLHSSSFSRLVPFSCKMTQFDAQELLLHIKCKDPDCVFSKSVPLSSHLLHVVACGVCRAARTSGLYSRCLASPATAPPRLSERLRNLLVPLDVLTTA